MKQASGWFLKLLAVAIGAQFLAVLWYDTGDTNLPDTVWNVIDILAFFALAITLVFHNRRMRECWDGCCDTVTQKWLSANLGFYTSIGCALLLIWNYSRWRLVAGMDAVGWVWVVMDILLPVLFLGTAFAIDNEVAECCDND